MDKFYRICIGALRQLGIGLRNEDPMCGKHASCGGRRASQAVVRECMLQRWGCAPQCNLEIGAGASCGSPLAAVTNRRRIRSAEPAAPLRVARAPEYVAPADRQGGAVGEYGDSGIVPDDDVAGWCFGVLTITGLTANASRRPRIRRRVPASRGATAVTCAGRRSGSVA